MAKLITAFTWNAFLNCALWAVVAFFLAIANKRQESRSAKIRRGIQAGLFIAILAFFINTIMNSGSWIISHLLIMLNIGRIHAWIGLGVVAVGLGAAIFKKKNRELYGLVEIVVAWFTATTISMRLLSPNHDLSTWASLAGSAYIVSRGIENATHNWKVPQKTSPDVTEDASLESPS
jgi:hypothetical protein